MWTDFNRLQIIQKITKGFSKTFQLGSYEDFSYHIHVVFIDLLITNKYMYDVDESTHYMYMMTWDGKKERKKDRHLRQMYMYMYM